jgi:hypothetical protein
MRNEQVARLAVLLSLRSEDCGRARPLRWIEEEVGIPSWGSITRGSTSDPGACILLDQVRGPSETIGHRTWRAHCPLRGGRGEVRLQGCLGRDSGDHLGCNSLGLRYNGGDWAAQINHSMPCLPKSHLCACKHLTSANWSHIQRHEAVGAHLDPSCLLSLSRQRLWPPDASCTGGMYPHSDRSLPPANLQAFEHPWALSGRLRILLSDLQPMLAWTATKSWRHWRHPASNS